MGTLCVLLLCGCGYHLKGQVPWPAEFKTIEFLAEGAPAPFIQNMNMQLLSSGVELKRDNEQANALLNLLDFTEDAREASLNSNDYVLTMTARIELSNLVYKCVKTPCVASGRQPFTVERAFKVRGNYIHSSANPLANAQAKQAIRRTLYKRLAQDIVSALPYLYFSPQK